MQRVRADIPCVVYCTYHYGKNSPVSNHVSFSTTSLQRGPIRPLWREVAVPVL